MESRTTARGFEPLLAEPSGFLALPRNHSVTLPCRIGLCPNSAMREANIPKHFARAPLLSVFVLVKMLYTRPRAGTNPVCRSSVLWVRTVARGRGPRFLIMLWGFGGLGGEETLGSLGPFWGHVLSHAWAMLGPCLEPCLGHAWAMSWAMLEPCLGHVLGQT